MHGHTTPARPGFLMALLVAIHAAIHLAGARGSLGAARFSSGIEERLVSSDTSRAARSG